MRKLVGRWQEALARSGLAPGERVAILLRNSLEWVCFDLAAQALGLIVVPLYITDSPDNIAHVLADSGARLLLLDAAERRQHRSLRTLGAASRRRLASGAPDSADLRPAHL
jgi:long-chain acyl-CoA synthetase